MFNSDIGVFKPLAVVNDASGELAPGSSCAANARTCPNAPQTFGFADTYSRNTLAFLQDFADCFGRMLSKGQALQVVNP